MMGRPYREKPPRPAGWVVVGYFVFCVFVFLANSLGHVLGIVGLLVALGVWGRHWSVVGAVIRGLAIFLWGAIFLVVAVTVAYAWILGQGVVFLDFLSGCWVIASAVLLSGILEGKKKVTAGRIAWLLTVCIVTGESWRQGAMELRHMHAQFEQGRIRLPSELRSYLVRRGTVVRLRKHGWHCELIFTNIDSSVEGMMKSNRADYVWRCWSNSAGAIQSGTGQVFEVFVRLLGDVWIGSPRGRKVWIEAGPFRLWWGYRGPHSLYLELARDDTTEVVLEESER